MAGRNLLRYVYVDGPDGVVGFGPGDDVPAWAVKKITNPKVWEEAPAAPAPKRRAAAKRAPSTPAPEPTVTVTDEVTEDGDGSEVPDDTAGDAD